MLAFLIGMTLLVSLQSMAQKIDPQSQALINNAEKAMGGQQAFDKIRHLSWNFLNIRSLTWDKHSGDVRIDLRNENSVYLYNTKTEKAKILKNGVEQTHPDSLAKYGKVAYEMWINDSYWLIMPFKLDDPGVKQLYLGEMLSEQGYSCDVIQITFENTGVTPDNKYLIYFDKKSGLVCQWDFFRNANDAAPLFTTPWLDYARYQGVLISGDRGERKLSNIHVFKKLPETVYTDFKRPKFL